MESSKDKKIRIKILMFQKEITGAEIARRLGVTRYAVNGVINFHWKSPRIRKAIANALGVPFKELWGEEERPRKAA